MQNTESVIISRVINIVLIISLKLNRIEDFLAKAWDAVRILLPDIATCFPGECGQLTKSSLKPNLNKTAQFGSSNRMIWDKDTNPQENCKIPYLNTELFCDEEWAQRGQGWEADVRAEECQRSHVAVEIRAVSWLAVRVIKR